MVARTAKSRRTLRIVVIAAVVVAVAAVVIWSRHRGYTPPPRVFDGSSEDLKTTVVVPTLDTLIPPSKNAIWCASFQFAWNELRDDVIREPIRITGVQDVADRLNNV